MRASYIPLGAVLAGLASSFGNLCLYGCVAGLVGAAASGERSVSAALYAFAGIAIAAKAAASYGFRAGLPGRSAEERRRLRRDTFLAILDGDRRPGSAPDSGSASSLLVDGIESLELYRGLHVPQLYIGMLAPLVAVAAVALYDPLSALALLAFVPVTPLVVKGMRAAFSRVTERYYRETAALAFAFQEGILGLPALKLFARGAEYGERIRADSEAQRVATMRLLAGNQLLILALDLSASLGSVIVGLAVASLRFGAGRLGADGFLFVVLASVELSRPLQLMGAYFFAGALGRSALGKTSAILAGERRIAEAEPAAGPSELRLDSVSFAYEDCPPCLLGASLRLERGCLVGLRGPSGSGKTTIRRLLSGAVSPSSGRVLVDGADYTGRRRSLSRLVAVADQQAYLFSGSVRDNLVLAKPGARDDELSALLVRLGLGGFADYLDAPVGEEGRLLSGGQRSRLALARAILRDAPFMVFDEPSAELDEETEGVIVAAIREESEGRGVLLVSHRDGPLAACDEVYSLYEGRLDRAYA